MILDTIIELQNRGFNSDFSLLGNHLFCSQTKCFFTSDQFEVVEIYGFDAEHSEREVTTIYAIECLTINLKGILFQTCHKHNPLLPKLRKFWN